MSDAPESKSESAATAAPPEGEGEAAATTEAAEAPNESPKAEGDSAPESPKAEEAKAEETEAKAEEAEAPKAEEPKAEEPKAEEPKAEEPKAEEPKAEAPKAEEPKAEAPKAEEPKASTGGGHKKGKKAPKPPAPEPVAPAPKKEPKPEAAKAKGARIGEEEEKSPQDLLLDNLPMVVVVCVIFSLIPVWWTYNSQITMQDSQQAWTDYGALKTKTIAEAEFDRLVGEHADTTAAPYIKIKWAAKLYETGEKAKVERARDLFKEVKRDYGHLDLISDLVGPQIEKIDAELASPRAQWAKPSTPGTAGVAPASSN